MPLKGIEPLTSQLRCILSPTCYYRSIHYCTISKTKSDPQVRLPIVISLLSTYIKQNNCLDNDSIDLVPILQYNTQLNISILKIIPCAVYCSKLHLKKLQSVLIKLWQIYQYFNQSKYTNRIPNGNLKSRQLYFGLRHNVEHHSQTYYEYLCTLTSKYRPIVDKSNI